MEIDKNTVSVSRSQKGENAYNVSYKYKKKIGNFLIEVQNDIEGHFDVIITIGNKDKFIIPGKFNLDNPNDQELLWTAVNGAQLAETPKCYGGSDDIWCGLTHAVKIIRGKVEEQKVSAEGGEEKELTPEANKLLMGEILNEVYDVVRRCREEPLVREHVNVIVSYLTILSCKIKYPLTLFFDGPTQSGKTFMSVRATDIFPRNMVNIIQSGSKTAYKYTGFTTDEDGRKIIDMSGRCLMFLERDGAEELIKTFKPLMSHDNYEVEDRTTTKEDGEFTGSIYVYRGFPSFVVMGAYSSTMSEQINRAINLAPEKSKEKDAEMNSSFWNAQESLDVWTPPIVLDTFKMAHEWIKPCDVSVHIFKNFLETIPLSPRDRNRLTGVIHTLTTLHQKRRVRNVTPRGFKYLASFEDIMIALGIYERIYEHSRFGIPKTTHDVLKHLQRMSDDSKGGRDTFTLDEIWNDIEHRKMLMNEGDVVRFETREDLSRYLSQLVNHGALSFLKATKGLLDRWIVKKKDRAKAFSLTKLFVESIFGDKDFQTKLEMIEKKYLTIDYPKDYVIQSENKLYDYIMDKCYFKENGNIYRGAESAVYKIIDNPEVRLLLFNDKYNFNVGNEEIRKKEDGEMIVTAEATRVVHPDDYEDWLLNSEEGQEYIRRQRAEQEEEEYMISMGVLPKEKKDKDIYEDEYMESVGDGD